MRRRVDNQIKLWLCWKGKKGKWLLSEKTMVFTTIILWFPLYAPTCLLTHALRQARHILEKLTHMLSLIQLSWMSSPSSKISGWWTAFPLRSEWSGERESGRDSGRALWVERTQFGSPYLRKMLNYKYRIRHTMHYLPRMRKKHKKLWNVKGCHIPQVSKNRAKRKIIYYCIMNMFIKRLTQLFYYILSLSLII